jgi:dihydrofolate reductase
VDVSVRKPRAGRYKLEEFLGIDALLLGRKTHEELAKAWPTIKDESGFADPMNGLPKYVVSTTVKNADWNKSHIIDGNVADEVRKLKDEQGQDILVYGSAALVNSLVQDNFIDEYRLMYFPIVLGIGKRLFDDGTNQTRLRLADSTTFASSVVVSTYVRATGN